MADRRRSAPGRPPRNRPSPRVRRRRALLGATLGVLVVVALLFAFGYPLRTFLQQRSQLASARAHLTQLDRQTQAVEAQSKQLQSDTAVERIAREQYGLVRPGETPYVLVPAAPAVPTLTVPATTTTTAPVPTTTTPRSSKATNARP